MCERTISTWPIHNCCLVCAMRFQFADLTCCCSPVQHSDKLGYSPRNVLQTMSIHKGISLFFHVWSPYFLSEHFGLDDKMTSRTAWVLLWRIFGLSNGGRSFTKNMHRKRAFSLGISNSNLACVIIALQRSRKVKKKKKSKFRLSSTLSVNSVQCPFKKLQHLPPKFMFV